MALGLANATELRRLVGTVGLAVAWLTTATTLASELALDLRIGAVRGIVSRFIAVVAQTGVGALLPRLWTVACEVAFSAAANNRRQ